jgi:4-amino-4-deoxy-L-arabinose transferase-like glycosyltransferase
MPALDRTAVLRGAAVGVVVLALAIAGWQVADAAADFATDSNVVFLFYAVALAGWAAAGFIAARRALDLPYTTGAVAAACSVVPVAAIAIVVDATRGDSPPVGAIVAQTFVAATLGIVGALVAARREAGA